MTKIKNFRIALRAREISRWLKRERGLETTPDLEIAIDHLIKEGKTWIEPAAVYSTLTRQIAEKTTTIAFPERSIAVSVIAVSIGPGLVQKRLEAESDAGRQALLAALEQEALSQSVSFAVRLIQEQAKEEDCELSALAVTPAEAGVQNADVLDSGFRRNDGLSALASLVGVQRIGINLDSSGSELPSHARVSWLFWTPIGKGASKRAEKAVA